MQSLPARAVPDRQLQRHVVGQSVLIVLMRVAQRQRVQVLTQQFNLEVADAVRTPVIRQLRGQIGRQPPPMIRLPQQKSPGVRSDPRIGLPQLYRAVERGLKQPPAVSRPTWLTEAASAQRR